APRPPLSTYTTLFRSRRGMKSLTYRGIQAAIPLFGLHIPGSVWPCVGGRGLLFLDAKETHRHRHRSVVAVNAPAEISCRGFANRSEEHTSELQSPDHL